MIEYYRISITTRSFGHVDARADTMNEVNDLLNRFKGEWSAVTIVRSYAPEIPTKNKNDCPCKTFPPERC